MSSNYFWEYSKYALANDLLNEGLIDIEKLNEVINFHHSQVWLPTYQIKNNYQVRQGELWNEYYGENILNPFNTQIINLPNTKIVSQYVRGLYTQKITDFHLETILHLVFSEMGGNKKYHTVQKSPSIVPLILFFENDVISGVNSGSYLYHASMNNIILNNNWEKCDVISRFKEITNDIAPLTKVAIAYALDYRRSMVEYGKRGYRNSLIEVGTMVQFLKETIEKTNNDSDVKMRSEILTDFSDNSITHLCGLNPRLSPIVLIQWIGWEK